MFRFIFLSVDFGRREVFKTKPKNNTGKMKLSQIKANPNNPRVIKDDKFEKLKKSISEFPKMMELRPMVINSDDIVLGGNMRLRALKDLGYNEIPDEWVKRADELTEEEQRRFIIADNVGFGEHDWEMLQNEWDIEELEEWGLDIPNFEIETLKAEDDEFIPTETKQTNVVYGDIYKIGDHKLMRGDSTKNEDVRLLFENDKTDLIFTDPPYDLIDCYSQNIFDLAKEDSHIFIMNSDKLLIENINNGWNYFRKIFAVDFRQARLISNNQPMTRVDLIAEFCKGKTKFNNLHDGFSTLIECAKIHNDNEKINFGHKQAKKVELPAEFILHYSNKGEIVGDLFLGSGTTMAACEQLSRICYGIELDPINCQIIIDRMKEKYNLDAVKIN